jgi:hypothetical protein
MIAPVTDLVKAGRPDRSPSVLGGALTQETVTVAGRSKVATRVGPVFPA